ncbi:MAG: AAC(3) family N-acetyltransferase [Acidobacteriota bacterium]
MTLPNTQDSLHADLRSLGLAPGDIVMVHSALGQVGWTVGGPVTVIRALLEAVGNEGTVVMPGESPSVCDPADWDDPRVQPEWHDAIREHLPLFDPQTTPTTMGAIPEAFRTYPGTLRSSHPLVSVCAKGGQATEITAEHALEFCEGRGTPFEKLYDLDSKTLLLGVGFNRCTSLHYAESLVEKRRTTTNRIPVEVDGERRWVETANMANDNGEHFPVVGEQFRIAGDLIVGCVGEAEAMLFSTRSLVDFAVEYFARVLV